MKTDAIVEQNEFRRRAFCRPLIRDWNIDEPFFCDLGTLWCTESHDDKCDLAYIERYGFVKPCDIPIDFYDVVDDTLYGRSRPRRWHLRVLKDDVVVNASLAIFLLLVALIALGT